MGDGLLGPNSIIVVYMDPLGTPLTRRPVKERVKGLGLREALKGTQTEPLNKPLKA